MVDLFVSWLGGWRDGVTNNTSTVNNITKTLTETLFIKMCEKNCLNTTHITFRIYLLKTLHNCRWSLSWQSVWRLSGSLVTTGIPKMVDVTKLIPRTEKRASLHTMYPLLFSDFNQNRNVRTNFTKTLQHQISWQSVGLYSSSCIWRADRHGEYNRRMFATLLRTHIK